MAVSLNCNKLQLISAETENYLFHMYFLIIRIYLPFKNVKARARKIPIVTIRLINETINKSILKKK